MLLKHALFAQAGEGETPFMKTFRTGEEGGEKNRAENSPGWLQCSAHGLFILRISSGDLRARHCVGCWREAGKWLTVTQTVEW